MIVNPVKFQLIEIDKKKQDHTKRNFRGWDKVIEPSPSVKLLGDHKIENRISAKKSTSLPI